MVKPRGCCERMAQVLIVALRDVVIPRDARSSTSPRCDEGQRCDKQQYLCPVSDRVEKDFVRAPDVCDYHARARVMELGATEEH